MVEPIGGRSRARGEPDEDELFLAVPDMEGCRPTLGDYVLEPDPRTGKVIRILCT